MSTNQIIDALEEDIEDEDFEEIDDSNADKVRPIFLVQNSNLPPL